LYRPFRYIVRGNSDSGYRLYAAAIVHVQSHIRPGRRAGFRSERAAASNGWTGNHSASATAVWSLASWKCDGARHRLQQAVVTVLSARGCNQPLAAPAATDHPVDHRRGRSSFRWDGIVLLLQSPGRSGRGRAFVQDRQAGQLKLQTGAASRSAFDASALAQNLAVLL